MVWFKKHWIYFQFWPEINPKLLKILSRFFSLNNFLRETIIWLFILIVASSKKIFDKHFEHITTLKLVLMFKGTLSFILEILYLFIIRFLQHISREVIPSCVDLHFSIYWISHELENRRRATQQMYENNFKYLKLKTKSL